jgi:dTDP-4-dehydrorhamnose reductase
MKILVIGANGQLGSQLCSRGKELVLDVVGLDLPAFDITDPFAVEKAFGQDGISLIINAAAYTAVDQAESEPQLAFSVNQDGPAHLASCCAKSKLPLVHVSTDYVFDGQKKTPYLETDPVRPLSVYGRSKTAGELAVRERLPEHIILRTSWLYGVSGNNFVKTMLRLGREKEQLKVVADQYGCPTYSADLAEAILVIAAYIRDGRNMAWGTYHYCGEGITTWHAFAEAIFGLAKEHDSLVVKEVERISTKEFPTPASRPANSALDCSLIKKHFGIHTKLWPESLARMLKSYYDGKTPS